MTTLGQFPQDTPQQDAVAVIHRLSEGYVLVVRGKTIACPSVHALSQAVQKQMKALEAEPIPVAAPVPSTVAPDWFSPAHFQYAHPAQVAVANLGDEPARRGAVQLSEQDQLFHERQNMMNTCRAVVAGDVSLEDLELAHREFFPHMPPPLVAEVLRSFGYNDQTATSDEPEAVTLPEQDLPDQTMPDETPEQEDQDLDDEDLDAEDLEPEPDPSQPTVVVDLAQRSNRRSRG